MNENQGDFVCMKKVTDIMSKNNNKNHRYKAKTTRNHNRDEKDMAENFNELAVKSSDEESSGSTSDEEFYSATFPLAMW